MLLGSHQQIFWVRIGVSQGAVVGPILLQIFVIDLPNYVSESHVSVFTYDIVIYHRSTDSVDV